LENAKLTLYQLFVLILLFETGSSIVITLGIDANQDAWMTILLGLALGLILFLVYYQLSSYYPNKILTQYTKNIAGPFLGSIIGYLYVIYFMYLAARVLRDFGELLLTFAYSETPLIIINAIMVLTIVYGVSKGIEVMARTGELFFIFLYLLAIVGFFLILFAGLIDINNLKPMFANGIEPIIKVTLKQTMYVPFGEVIVFSMILPYLNHFKKGRKIGLYAISLSGINLALTTVINVAVLGVDVNKRSPFPLLSTIQLIKVAEFLERLDVFFMLALIMGCFFKISIYFYASVVGISDLLKVKEHKKLAFPLGIILILVSMMIATSYPEHIKEGLNFVPLYLHLPMQVILPLFLLVVSFFRNRKKGTKADK